MTVSALAHLKETYIKPAYKAYTSHILLHIVMTPHPSTRLYVSHLLIGQPPYSADRFRVDHRAAITKIWLTFEDQGWFRVGCSSTVLFGQPVPLSLINICQSP